MWDTEYTISGVIALPLSYWVMSGWLEEFAFRITFSAQFFLFAGGAALMVAIAATGYHAVRSATANPVNVIRAE